VDTGAAGGTVRSCGAGTSEGRGVVILELVVWQWCFDDFRFFVAFVMRLVNKRPERLMIRELRPRTKAAATRGGTGV
jgi:hypothetical protein